MATTLEMLLAALERKGLPPLPEPAQSMPLLPAPASPVTVGPSPTMPDAAPAAPAPALDMNFVNQFAGPPPVAPVQNEPSLLDKIAAVLGGISQGPQYGAQLREERERPIRDYQAQLEKFNQRRTVGLEAATRKQERQQDAATRRAEANAEREFDMWLKKTGVNDEMAIQQMRQAFEIQKVREQERIADERLQKQQEQQNKIETARLTSKYRALGAKKYATELARKDLDPNFQLSPGAEKWYSARVAIDEARAARAASGGSGGGSSGGPIMARLETGAVVPASLVDRTKGIVPMGGRPIKVVEYFGGKIPAQPRQAQQGGPTMMTPPPDTVQAYMKRWGIKDRNQAIRELMEQ